MGLGCLESKERRRWKVEEDGRCLASLGAQGWRHIEMEITDPRQTLGDGTWRRNMIKGCPWAETLVR